MQNNEIKESTFSKLWNNKRTHALMVLGMWFLFFVLAVPLINGLTNNQKPVKVIKIEEKWESLLKNNYSFTYKININGTNYVYSGEKNDKITLGLKDTENETMKYYIDDNITYKVLLDNYEIIDNLYENIDINLLDVNYIFNLIKDKTNTLKDNKYSYELDNYQIEISSNNDAITSIKIILDESIYELSYNNIGLSEIKRIEVNKSE